MSEEIKRPCRCLLQQSDKGGILKDINERISKLGEKERTEDDIYKSRLAACRECEFLEDGTCLKCGCYPEFRAAFRNNKCPAKRW